MTNQLVGRTMAMASVDRMPRAVQRQIETEHYRGLVVGAQINAVAFAAYTGMNCAGTLTATAVHLNNANPLGGGLYQDLLQGFGDAANALVRRMAL